MTVFRLNNVSNRFAGSSGTAHRECHQCYWVVVATVLDVAVTDRQSGQLAFNGRQSIDAVQ